MKVSELIKELQGLDPNMEIYLQKDQEGNGYAPLRVVDPDCIVTRDGDYDYMVYNGSDTAVDADMDHVEWAELQAGARSMVLSP